MKKAQFMTIHNYQELITLNYDQLHYHSKKITFTMIAIDWIEDSIQSQDDSCAIELDPTLNLLNRNTLHHKSDI